MIENNTLFAESTSLIPEALVVQAYATSGLERRWEYEIEIKRRLGEDGLLHGDRNLLFLHVSPEGGRVAVGLIGDPTRFVVLDAEDGTELHTVLRPDCSGWVLPSGWSSDGKKFALIGNCGVDEQSWVEIVDGQTFEVINQNRYAWTSRVRIV